MIVVFVVVSLDPKTRPKDKRAERRVAPTRRSELLLALPCFGRDAAVVEGARVTHPRVAL